MTYHLTDPYDKILRTKLDTFNFNDPPIDPVQLSQILYDKMVEHDGMGLAANQIGLSHRVFVMNHPDGFIACFNPKVVDSSQEMVYLEEGCLSYPGLWVKIKRPKTIKVRYTQSNGETVTRKFTGISARCFLHELDHLDGIVHISRAHPAHRQQAMSNWKKYKRKLKSTGG